MELQNFHNLILIKSIINPTLIQQVFVFVQGSMFQRQVAYLHVILNASLYLLGSGRMEVYLGIWDCPVIYTVLSEKKKYIIFLLFLEILDTV